MKTFLNFAFLNLFFCSIIYGTIWHQSLKDPKMLRFRTDQVIQLVQRAKNDLGQKFDQYPYKFIVSDDLSIKITGFEGISSIDFLDKNHIKDNLFLVFCHTDDDYFHALKKIKDNVGKFYALPFFGPKTRYVWTDKYALNAVDEKFAFVTKISHQNIDVHEIICQCLQVTKHLPGDYVEIGVYVGGSALTALHYMKFAGMQRKSYFLDTFDGMTYEEAHQSPDLIWDNTHKLWGVEQTMNYVSDLLKTTGQHYKLVQSNICADLLPKEIEKIVVCNVDVDLYEPTLEALNKVAPLVVKGGIIICEDPTSTPTLVGALLAMEEFLLTEMGSKFLKILVGGQYLLIKMAE
ncbi:MAG: TylF/MycF/NovP-related O-methyltransferase [Candidatus Babeliales bacterium]